MNKGALLLGLLLMTTRAEAQQLPVPALPGLPYDSLSRAPNYHGVVPMPGISAMELQGRAREWVALTFQDAHQVMQLDDPTRGVLIGRGYTEVLVNATRNRSGTPRLVSFTFRFDFRDGRYRYELRDLGTRVESESASSYTDTYATRRNTYAQLEWRQAATATLATSSRQRLMLAGNTNNSDDYGFDGKLKSAWAQTSADINAALLKLLQSLQQCETAPAGKW